MTRRAARMLAALEDGCTTRAEFYAHAGQYFIVNNSASELRRAGVGVAWDHATDTYSLLDQGGAANGTPSPRATAPLIEQPDGQLAMSVAA